MSRPQLCGFSRRMQRIRQQQKTTGNGAVADYANPEQMNRYTWYVTHHWKVPYPGDAKLYPPADVPGAYIPSPDTE